MAPGLSLSGCGHEDGEAEKNWVAFSRPEAPGTLYFVRTVQPPEGFEGKAYTGDGPAINSDFLNGMPKDRAKSEIIDWLEAQGKGQRKVNYKLRDWLFSRQRYWGEPFPIYYDGEIPQLIRDEQVTLPPVDAYLPTEDGDPKPSPSTDGTLRTHVRGRSYAVAHGGRIQPRRHTTPAGFRGTRRPVECPTATPAPTPCPGRTTARCRAPCS